MQKMLYLFRRRTAKLEPIVNVAGKAGGTIIVTRSRARIIMVPHDNLFCQTNYKHMLSESRTLKRFSSKNAITMPTRATIAMTLI